MVRVRLRGSRRDRVRARRTGALLAAILAGPLLGACGQRGPLYLPRPPAEPPPRVRTAPAEPVIVRPALAPPAAPAQQDETGRPARRAD